MPKGASRGCVDVREAPTLNPTQSSGHEKQMGVVLHSLRRQQSSPEKLWEWCGAGSGSGSAPEAGIPR